MHTFISRRELLRRAGLVGAAAMVPVDALRPAAAGDVLPAQSAAARSPLEQLSPTEGKTLDAVVSRLIPADATGIGALEAGATRYIDRALGGALASSREAYRAGLAAIDRYAQASRGRTFADLTPTEQDSVLVDVESGTATGFPDGSTSFFSLMRAHTIQGTFCDPFYGGNLDFAGWDLIEYPGVRTIVTGDEQRLGADTPHTHKSAYDLEMFNKSRSRVDSTGEPHHGD